MANTPDMPGEAANETIDDFLRRLGFSDDVVADDGSSLQPDVVQGNWPRPQLFTLAEANALIPQARMRVIAVQVAARRLEEEQQAMARMQPWQLRSPFHNQGAQAARVAEAVHNMDVAVRSLFALGCELKDLDRGLLDFQSVRDGEIVNLCWMLGEDEIRYWHSLNEGYRYRKPI